MNRIVSLYDLSLEQFETHLMVRVGCGMGTATNERGMRELAESPTVTPWIGTLARLELARREALEL